MRIPLRRLTLLAVGALLIPRASAAASRVDAIVADVETQAASPEPASATATLVHRQDDVERTETLRLLVHGHMLRVELPDGSRMLVRTGEIIALRDGTTGVVAGESVLGSLLQLEDLAPFTSAGLVLPQISDEGPAGIVVSSAPRPPSVYALLVYTIDPDRSVVTGVKYYQHVVNNLTKRERRSDFVRVAGRWRPQSITIEDVREPRSTTLTLRWQARPELPRRLLTPEGLHDSSDRFVE